MTPVNVKRIMRALEVTDQHRPVELQTAQFTGSQARAAIENERLKRLNEQLDESIRRIGAMVEHPIKVEVAAPARFEPVVPATESRRAWFRDHVFSAGIGLGGAFVGYGVGHWDDPLIICGLCLVAMTVFARK